MSTSTGQNSVLRARIGVGYPHDVDRTELEQRLVTAIAAAVSDLGGQLDVLRLDLAAAPIGISSVRSIASPANPCGIARTPPRAAR